jgi:hypothetical protein
MPGPESTPLPPAGANDSAAALLAVVDAYLEDLRQGKAPDRAAVLAAHPELAPQLESCLAALDFIHRAEHTDPAVPPTLGDFRIVREIGRGAMGVVYEAEQASLKRKVALKVLRFGASPDQEAMARFRREAETVAALHHTNIVPLFAVGSEAGVHFFAMQLIAGRSLAAVLDEANAAGRALEAKKVVGWGVQAAEALAHAHARGVVHRDVKPSNLLLDEEGTVWLTDFGLARRRDEATLTVAGAQLGTPRYMSPEQAAAARAPVDQRSDVYSLGASLYELATGKPVFEVPTTGQLFEQIAQAEPVPPRRHRKELPRDLETVLLRCLAKDPAQRYPTARDLADDLRRVASGDPIKARRPGLLLRLRRWAGRRRPQAKMVGVAAVAMVATLVLGVVGLSWWQADREARKGSVTLLVEGGAGRGEILGAGGKPPVPPFRLPTESPVELPGGWYRLRVIQPDRLSEEYELFIEQGQHRTFTVGSNDRQLWEPMPISWTFAGDFGLLHITSPSGLMLQSEDGWTGQCEIYDKDGKPAVPPFTLPAKAPIELPEGGYRLWATGLPENFDLEINQGRPQTWTVGSKRMLKQEYHPPDAVIIKRFGKPTEGWGKRKENWKEWEKWQKNPFVPAVLWELTLKRQDPALPPLNDDEWIQFCDALMLQQRDVWGRPFRRGALIRPFGIPLDLIHLGNAPTSKPPRYAFNRVFPLELIQPAPDLDGDGVGDLVFAFDRFVLAISGKEGKVLWCRELHSNVFLTETKTWSLLTETEKVSLLSLSVVQSIPGVTVPLPPWIYTETETRLAGPPLVADIDGDGKPDLILAHGGFLCWVKTGRGKDEVRRAFIRPCVEALSGRTGATLWRHEAANLAERLVLGDNEVGQRVKKEVQRGDFSSLEELDPLTGLAFLTERATDKGRTLLAGLFDRVERLDLLKGHTVAPSWPLSRDWDDVHAKGYHVSTLSADGKIAFVQSFSEDHGGKGELGENMSVIDTARGYQCDISEPRVLADLNGDGVPEVITLDGVFDVTRAPHPWESKLAHYPRLELPDGHRYSLVPLWTPEQLPLARRRGAGAPYGGQALLVGPDFNGDCCPDVFVAGVCDGERFGHPEGVNVLVAGLRSGKDGRPLWLTAEPIGKGEFTLQFREPKEWRRKDFAGAVFYWRSAPGAAGHFVVNVDRLDPVPGFNETVRTPHVAFLFAADTGRPAHRWPGVTVEGVADLDGDGLLDLYGRRGDQFVTLRGTAPEVWRRLGRWRWQWLAGRDASDDPEVRDSYLTGPVPHADLDGDGIADVLRFTQPKHSWSQWKCEAYSGRDGRPLWVRSMEDSKHEGFDTHWVECLDLEGQKRPVVVVWGEYGKVFDRAWVDGTPGPRVLREPVPECTLLDGRTGKLKWRKEFPGEPRPDLLYRQPDGRLALVYRSFPGDVLVAVDANGEKVHEAPFPTADAKKELPLPEGFELRPLVSLRLQSKIYVRYHHIFDEWVEIIRAAPMDEPLWRFGGWELKDYDEAGTARKWMPYPVGWRVDPADSALLRFYGIGDDKWHFNRLTLLWKGIPSNPAREVPISSYPDEVVLKRPLPWLDRARSDAVAGLGSVAAYLALVAVLAGVGRRKTALFLLALFILLPAFAAVFALVLVLALLLAALPWKTGPEGYERPLDFTGTVWGKSTLGLLLLPAALLTNVVLGVPALNGAVQATFWTYPVVLVPLIVLALVGWKKTALGLLIPCLLLLLYLNWPPDESWRTSNARIDHSKFPSDYVYDDKWYFLDFALLKPTPGSGPEANGSLLPEESWDWSGWYWLWPGQMAAWQGGDKPHPLVLALVLVGGAEFVRWLIRNDSRREH